MIDVRDAKGLVGKLALAIKEVVEGDGEFGFAEDTQWKLVASKKGDMTINIKIKVKKDE